MPLGVEVLIDQETLRRIELSSLDYYTHHISPHTIPPKMTKLSSKLNLTKLFYISPQQNSGGFSGGALGASAPPAESMVKIS